MAKAERFIHTLRQWAHDLAVINPVSAQMGRIAGYTPTTSTDHTWASQVSVSTMASV